TEDRPHDERRARALARAERRIRLPVLQSAAGAVGAAQRRTAAAADRPAGGRASRTRIHRAHARRPRKPRRAQAARAFRRTGAARRDCACARLGSAAAGLRRADRRSRPRHGRRHSFSAAVTQSRPRQDHRHGYARPEGCRPRAPDRPSRQGIDARRARGRNQPSAMKYFPLLWAALFRRKTRTILTLLSVVIAFVLFGLLQAVQLAFEAGADTADARRLLT